MKKQSTKENLTKALRLIKRGWTQDAMARIKCGLSTFSSDPEATKFCMMGALIRTNKGGGFKGFKAASRAIEKAFKKLYGFKSVNIQFWNDQENRTKKEVIKVFETAIELLDEN